MGNWQEVRKGEQPSPAQWAERLTESPEQTGQGRSQEGGKEDTESLGETGGGEFTEGGAQGDTA